MSRTKQDIGWAMDMMEAGHRVQRDGWNGKDMYLYLVGKHVLPQGDAHEPCIVMHTAQGTEQPGWLASQSDLRATDWRLYTGPVEREPEPMLTDDQTAQVMALIQARAPSPPVDLTATQIEQVKQLIETHPEGGRHSHESLSPRQRGEVCEIIDARVKVHTSRLTKGQLADVDKRIRGDLRELDPKTAFKDCETDHLVPAEQGMIAYNRYKAAVGGTAHDGQTVLPDWLQLGRRQMAGWVAAAGYGVPDNPFLEPAAGA